MALYKKTKKRTPKKTGEMLSNADKAIATSNKLLNSQVDKLEAEGVAVHSVVNARTPSAFLNDVNAYSDPNISDRTQTVPLCRKLRSIEGVCSTVADLLADFAVTKGSFSCDNEELEDILNKWAEFVNSSVELAKNKGMVFPVPGLRAVSRKIFDDYITDGDSVFTLFWQTGVKMNPQESGKALFLPVSIKTLDSLSISIDPELAKLGIEKITLEIDRDVKERILNPQDDADKYLKNLIPKEWMKFINQKEDIILDPNVTFHIKRNGKDWKPYGESLFLKAFGAVANKRRLQAVDESTIDGLINRITVFKLGLADKEKNPAYHIPSSRRVELLIELLTNPKRTNAIVWPGPDLEIDDIVPDAKILEFDKKYKQADVDILRALHTSPLLIDGGSSGQAVRDWAAFVATEVGLDYIRSEFEKIFTVIGREIALTNKMKYEQLYYKYETQLLKDEKRVRNFALQVWESGGMSAETFVKTMGYDFETEKRLKEKEKSEGVDQLFVNPYRPGINPPEGGRPDNTTDEETPEGAEKEEEEAALRPYDDVTLYYEIYTGIFDKLKRDIAYKLDLFPDDIDLAKMTLASSFVQFKMLVETQLMAVYKKYSGGSITKELQYLKSWNEEHINGFYNELKKKLEEDSETFIDVLNKSKYRILMYAQEGYTKAMWVGRITKAKLEGKKKARVVCPDSSTCGFSKEYNNKEFDLGYLIINFPDHPNCSCKLEFGE